MERPISLIFVPGSWHRPKCYDKVIKILERKHDLECISVTLPSTLGDPGVTFKNDIDAARAAIIGTTRCGNNAIVVAHSYGGMVANSAIKELSRRHGHDVTNAASTSTGHVVGLILIASGFTLTGLAFMDPFFGYPPPSWRVNSSTGFAELVTPPSTLFYHDLPADEATYWVSKLRPQSLKALFEGGEHAYAGWMDVPTWYVGTSEDKAMPVFAQRVQVGMARQMGGTVEHRELATSHSPFLSRPEIVATIIVEAISDLKGRDGHDGTNNGDGAEELQQKERIAFPVVSLWKPDSWLKFGVPYAFGRGIGSLIMTWDWGRKLWR